MNQNRLRKLHLLITILAALAIDHAGHAMPVNVFDKMEYHDRGDYITSLVRGAYVKLREDGRPQDAESLLKLFLDKGPRGGFAEFDKALDQIRALNQSNSADPNYAKPPYEVEHAFALTLKNHQIGLPVSYLLSINKDFKPTHPSR